MKRFWYVSFTNEYPLGKVISVDYKGGHSLIEMNEKASKKEIKRFGLSYLGKDCSFKADVKKNYMSCVKRIVGSCSGT